MSRGRQSTESERSADIPPDIGQEPEGEEWTEAYFRMLVRGAIRKIFFLWPVRKKVMLRARTMVPKLKKDGKPGKDGVWYKCERCGVLGKPQHSKKQTEILNAWKDQVKFAKKDGRELPPRPDIPWRIWVDHVDPVVPLDGRMPDWHTYIMRSFVSDTAMQALCDTCHKAKSKEENRERRKNRLDGRNPAHTAPYTDEGDE